MNDFLMLNNRLVIPKSRISSVGIRKNYSEGEELFEAVLYSKYYNPDGIEVPNECILFQCKSLEECEEKLIAFAERYLGCDFWER